MAAIKYTNRVVVFINAWLCIVLGYIVTHREMFQGLSNDLFPDATNLMDSLFAEIIVRTEFVLIIIVIAFFMIFKDRRLKSNYATKLWSNILIGIFLSILGSCLLSELYQIS